MPKCQSIKVNGVWKKCDSYIKVGGSWKSIVDGFIKIAGVWKDLCGPLPIRFEMLVTSPAPPRYNFFGVLVDLVDNKDGTYTYSTFNAVTSIHSITKNETAVHIIKALDLITVADAWNGVTGLTSFDASGLTATTEVDRAWSLCMELTSFDASGLTAVTSVDKAWLLCIKLACIKNKSAIPTSAAGYSSITQLECP